MKWESWHRGRGLVMLVGTTKKMKLYLPLSSFTLNWTNAILSENLS